MENNSEKLNLMIELIESEKESEKEDNSMELVIFHFINQNIQSWLKNKFINTNDFNKLKPKYLNISSQEINKYIEKYCDIHDIIFKRSCYHKRFKCRYFSEKLDIPEDKDAI